MTVKAEKLPVITGHRPLFAALLFGHFSYEQLLPQKTSKTKRFITDFKTLNGIFCFCRNQALELVCRRKSCTRNIENPYKKSFFIIKNREIRISRPSAHVTTSKPRHIFNKADILKGCSSGFPGLPLNLTILTLVLS